MRDMRQDSVYLRFLKKIILVVIHLVKLELRKRNKNENTVSYLLCDRMF